MAEQSRYSLGTLVLGVVIGAVALYLLIQGLESRPINVETKRPVYCGNQVVNISLKDGAPHGSLPDTFVACAGDSITWQNADGESIQKFSIDFDGGKTPFGRAHFDSTQGSVTSGSATAPCFLCSYAYYKYKLTITDASGGVHSFDPGGMIMK